MRIAIIVISFRIFITAAVLQNSADTLWAGNTEESAVSTWGPVQRTIRYDYRIMNPASRTATKIDVYVPLPFESPRQKVHYLHFPEKGKQRVFTDVHGQRLIQYHFDSLRAGECVNLGYVVGITLKNMRWNASAQFTQPVSPELAPDQKKLYLKSEAVYSMESALMRRTASDLAGTMTNDFEKLTKIHDYIIGKIRYVRDGKWDPAAAVLSRGTGSCSEYNYVLSGLCRLAGLPTRCVGGTTNGFRSFPTTDTVFHRWTEVFLSDYGWFPVDCSRDANPIRGKRSHFGRVFVDVMVWCRQAGGEDDSLGSDYRAKSRVNGFNPGIRVNHRTRWFAFHPEEQVKAAHEWFSGDAGDAPGPDLLECALVYWDKATEKNRVKMIRALAASGRNECLRRAAGLAEAEKLRESCIRKLCGSPALAETILEKSHHLYRFRSWFRSNESRLVPTGDGRFRLTGKAEKKQIPFRAASSEKIWAALSRELVDRLKESLNSAGDKTLVIMPVKDQCIGGLGEESTSIHSTLKKLVSTKMKVKLSDETGFDRLMEEQGPGSGEYWRLANGDGGGILPVMVPDIILVPLCITEKSTVKKKAVLYHIEFKVLELRNRKYTKIVARMYGHEKNAELDRDRD